MRKGQGLIWVVIIIAIIAVIVVWMSQKPSAPSTTAETLITPTSTLTPSLTASPSINPLKDYQNTQLGFSLQYPPNVKVSQNLDGTVSFSFWGPTQKTETELYDGFAINIDRADIVAKASLKDTIQADIDQKKEQLGSDFVLIQTIAEYTSWPYPGAYSYRARDFFGEAAYIYLPQDSDTFLLVTVTVKDPQNLGFADTASAIVSKIVFSASAK